MLREHGKLLARAWFGVYVVVVAAVFALLTVIPELQRVDPAPSSAHANAIKLTALGVCVVLGWPLLLSRFGLYESQRRESIGRQVARIFLANTIGVAAVSLVTWALDAPFTPLFPVALGGLLFTLQLGLHLPVFYLLHTLRRSGRNFRNVLIIGAGPRAGRTMEAIERHPEWGYRIIGYVDDGSSQFTPAVPPERTYKYADMPHLLRERTVDEVLVACPRSMLGSLAPIVNECMLIGVPVTVLTDMFGDQIPPPRIGRFDGMSTLSFAPVHHNEFELLLKRGIDMLGGLVGLAISAPALLVAAAAIRLTSPGPVFFRQVRLGMNGHPFEMLKLRTMCIDAEDRKADLMHLNEMDGPVFKIHDDPRITPVGGFLRKFSIDELPQFWNVLRGDMSAVGPRPPTPDEVLQYQGGDRRRLSMRPGLTCLWQVSGRNDVSFDRWMQLDLEYIDEWSLWGDVRIILKTIPEVLRGTGAS
jgi:exopolysaccharide biosynthesis polyprenyl glycosylphosphotransferase